VTRVRLDTTGLKTYDSAGVVQVEATTATDGALKAGGGIVSLADGGRQVTLQASALGIGSYKFISATNPSHVVSLAGVESGLQVRQQLRTIISATTQTAQTQITAWQQSTGSAPAILEAGRGVTTSSPTLNIALTLENSSIQTRALLSGAGLFVGPAISASNTVTEGRIEVYESVYALNATSYLRGLRVTGGTDTTEGLSLSYDTTADAATIQAVDDGVGYKPILLQPSGGETRLYGTHFIGTTGSGVGALAGYLTVIINSQVKKIPFYNES
jgi:hypothetical protein